MASATTTTTKEREAPAAKAPKEGEVARRASEAVVV